MWGGRNKNNGKRKAQLRAEWARYRAEKVEFVRQFGDDALCMVASWKDAPLLLVFSGSQIAWAELEDGSGFAVRQLTRIPWSAVKSVTLLQESSLQNYKKRVVTPVVTSKKKSAVGRGLVGAFVAGPAGLLLGAASALTPETQVVEHVGHENAVRVALGKPTLTLQSEMGEHIAELEMAVAKEIREALLRRDVRLECNLPA